MSKLKAYKLILVSERKRGQEFKYMDSMDSMNKLNDTDNDLTKEESLFLYEILHNKQSCGFRNLEMKRNSTPSLIDANNNDESFDIPNFLEKNQDETIKKNMASMTWGDFFDLYTSDEDEESANSCQEVLLTIPITSVDDFSPFTPSFSTSSIDDAIEEDLKSANFKYFDKKSKVYIKF